VFAWKKKVEVGLGEEELQEEEIRKDKRISCYKNKVIKVSGLKYIHNDFILKVL